MLPRRTHSHPAPYFTPNSRRLTLLQTLCHCDENQVPWNQADPRSLSKIPGVGHTLKFQFSGISNIRALCPLPVCNIVNVTLAGSPFVFITLQIPFLANPFLSHPSESPGGVTGRAHVKAKPLLELRRRATKRMTPPRSLCSDLSVLCVTPFPAESKLSVAGVSESEQKLRSAGILYCGSAKTTLFSDITRHRRTLS